MLFRHSAVSEVTRDRVVELWQTLPRDIHPLYLGSGEIAIGIDATGMQGLDFQHGQYRDTITLDNMNSLTSKHLHIFRDRAISRHYEMPELVVTSEKGPTFSSLPNGWLDYELIIDGKVYTCDDLLAGATDWRREFEPTTGVGVTSFVVDEVLITWRAGIGKDAVEMDFAFSAEDQTSRSRRIGLRAHCHLTLRGGESLATGGTHTTIEEGLIYRRWSAETATSGAEIYEPVDIGYAWMSTEPVAFEQAPDTITLVWEAEGASVGTGLRLVCGSDRDGTESIEHARTRRDALHCEGINTALAGVTQTWADYFDGTADVYLGDATKEFLLKQSQYLLRAGGKWEHGVPLGTLWTRKFNARTFWDTFFAADGLLRCGHVDELRVFCDWLCRTMQPTGRPHCWMTHYDGMMPTNPEKDIAYQNCLAFCGIAIRLYETTQDERDLKERVFPYLYRVADYAVKELFVEEGGRWKLAGTTAHDVGDEILEADTQKDMVAWATVCIAKCAAYAAAAGVDDVITQTAERIADFYRKEKIAITAGTWVGWLPYLALPIPFEDREAWFKTVIPNDRHLDRSGYAAMCWNNFTFASSLLIEGDPDYALHWQEMGLNEVVGPGYLNENAFERQVDGHAPYVPSHGAYLSSLMLMFADNDGWDDEVRVAVNFPGQWRSERIAWRDVLTFNGCRVSGSYEPSRLDVRLTADRPCRVRLRIPMRAVGEPITVLHNGKRVDVKVDLDSETVVVPIESGEHRFEIERDLTAKFDVVLWEPAEQGREFAAVLQDGGQTVRWLRDYDGLERVIGDAKTLVYHAQHLNTPSKYAQTIEAALRRGLNFVTMHHAASPAIEERFSELLGVNPTFDIDEFWWLEPVVTRTWTMTDEGVALMPHLPRSFEIPTVLKIDTAPEDDVQVLARDERGQATVTRRQVGRGARDLDRDREQAHAGEFDLARKTYHAKCEARRLDRSTVAEEPGVAGTDQSVGPSRSLTVTDSVVGSA